MGDVDDTKGLIQRADKLAASLSNQHGMTQVAHVIRDLCNALEASLPVDARTADLEKMVGDMLYAAATDEAQWWRKVAPRLVAALRTAPRALPTRETLARTVADARTIISRPRISWHDLQAADAILALLVASNDAATGETASATAAADTPLRPSPERSGGERTWLKQPRSSDPEDVADFIVESAWPAMQKNGRDKDAGVPGVQHFTQFAASVGGGWGFGGTNPRSELFVVPVRDYGTPEAFRGALLASVEGAVS